MKNNIKIRKADLEDVPQVVDMVGALLQEIMQSIGVNVFDYNTEDATLQLEDFLNLEKYWACPDRTDQGIWTDTELEAVGSHHAASSAVRQNPGIL